MPVNLDINEFEYQLPTEKIAKYPLAERGGSLLLHFDGEGITKQSDIQQYKGDTGAPTFC